MTDVTSDAVYVFGNDRQLVKMNRAADLIESAQRLFLIGRRCCEMFWHGVGTRFEIRLAMV